MFAIALGSSRQGDEELAGVAIFPRICHAHDPCASVLQLEGWLLIVEFAAKDAVTTAAVPYAVHKQQLYVTG